jgi:hypothetical protein
MTPRQQGFLAIALGFGIWMVALSALYALQATGCALAWDRIALGPIDFLRALLWAVFAVHVGALIYLYRHCGRKLSEATGDETGVFLWRVSKVLTVGAIAATLWLGAALVLPASACA